MTSPISRFNNSRTRCKSERGHGKKQLAESKFGRGALDGIAFDGVADLIITETLDADAAFHARRALR